jgi:hypothetical protein
MLTGRTQGEEPTKTEWWKNVHVDALWLTPAASVASGVVGIHVTLTIVGRWQVFLAPGAILMNVPTRHARVSGSPPPTWASVTGSSTSESQAVAVKARCT